MRPLAFTTENPPDSTKTYPVGGEPLIWIVYFLFNGVDAENPTEAPEVRDAKMNSYAAAAREYLAVYYEVFTEAIAIRNYYFQVTEKAIAAAPVESGHHTSLSASLIGKWIGGQVRKEAIKKCYATTILTSEEWKIRKDSSTEIQAALADAIFDDMTKLEPKESLWALSAALQMKLAEAAKIAREYKVKAAVKGGWDSLEASSAPPSAASDPVLLAWNLHPKFPFDTAHLLSTEADLLLRSPESSGS